MTGRQPCNAASKAHHRGQWHPNVGRLTGVNLEPSGPIGVNKTLGRPSANGFNGQVANSKMGLILIGRQSMDYHTNWNSL